MTASKGSQKNSFDTLDRNVSTEKETLCTVMDKNTKSFEHDLIILGS